MQPHWGGSRAQKANLKPTWSLCSSPDNIAVGSRLHCGIVHPGVVWPIIRGTMDLESLTPIFYHWCYSDRGIATAIGKSSVRPSVGLSVRLTVCGFVVILRFSKLITRIVTLTGIVMGGSWDLKKCEGLSPEALHQIFTAIVQSVITYALQSFAGQLSKGDKSRINAVFRKALNSQTRSVSHIPWNWWADSYCWQTIVRSHIK